MPKIAFISPVDPRQDIRHFSGITYHLYHALEQYAEIIPVIVAEPSPFVFNLYREIVSRLVRFSRTKYKWELHPWHLKYISRMAQEKIDKLDVDCALAIGQAYLTDWHGSVPVSCFSDTIYGTKVEYYWGSTSKWQLNEMVALNNSSVQNSKKIFLTSDFAFCRAAQITGVDIPTSKKVVTLIGANLAGMKPKPIPVRVQNPLHAIWIGRDWVRKGGEDAIQTAIKLNAMGINITLHIVGAKPQTANYECVNYEGFLNKQNPSDLDKFQRLMEQCHFFFLPTLTDLTPCALAEAAAFSQVIVARAVGGIPEMFPDDSAILIDPFESFPDAAVRRIANIIQEDILEQYSIASRTQYQNSLNWDVVAQKIISGLDVN